MAITIDGVSKEEDQFEDALNELLEKHKNLKHAERIGIMFMAMMNTADMTFLEREL